MIISKENKNRYLYEYAFWDAIDIYNNGLDDKKKSIRTREARAFRRELGELIKADGKSLENCPIGLFTRSVNSVLENRMGYRPYQEETGKDRLFRKSLNDYIGMTGTSPEKSELYGDTCYLPISPYDPRYFWRKAMLENGSRLASIRVDDVENIDTFDRDLMRNSQVNVYSRPILRENSQGNGFYAANDLKITFFEADDRSGLTMLMPYMTSDEYSNVSDWVNRDLDNQISYEDLMKRRRNMQKAVAVLHELSNLGRTYTISKDEYPGQIKANVKGTKLNVRLTEKQGTEEYIGSVYDDGARYMFSTTRKDGNTNRMHNPNTRDVVNLVRFALGEDVKRLDSDKLVGENEDMERGVGKGRIDYNAVYLNSTGLTAVYRDITPLNDVEAKQEEIFKNKVRMVVNTQNRTGDTTTMLNKEDAENYLRGAVDRARNGYNKALDVERIIKEWNDHKDEREVITHEDGSISYGDLEYVPTFDGNPNIAVLQQSYWDVLTGKKDTLIKPFEEEEDITGDVGETYGESLTSREALMKVASYDNEQMSAEEIVRQHALDSVEKTIGQYDKQLDGLRFDPVGVSTFDESGYGIYRNNDDIVKAMKLLDMNPDELRGDAAYNGSIKDRLIKFNGNTASKMKDIANEFVQNAYQTIVHTLSSRGVTVDKDSVLMDDNGIVKYKGVYANTEGNFDKKRNQVRPKLEIEGQIGQIFVPNEKGVVTTQYAGTKNFAFVPGYLAHIKFQNLGENKTMEERTILQGYEQRLLGNLRYQLMQDVLDLKNSNVVNIGTTTSVNNTYRGIEATRYDVDFEKNFLEQGLEQDILDTIIKTQAQRVRYSNEIRDGSSIHADFRASQYENFDYANDNYADPYSVTGNRNISVLTEESDGYFDPIATTSTSTNQGAVRYLVDGAKVTPTGEIIPSVDKNDRCSLFHHEIAKFSEYDPYDRQCMMLSNIMQANSVSSPVQSMDIAIGSWTQDDAIVVTKAFAEKYKMRKNDGSLRPLVVQDKLSDMHGNKGVISYVLDPEKSVDAIIQEGKELGFSEKQSEGLLKMHELAKKNPDVEVFMAPFTQPSRFNAGTAREKMSDSYDGVDIDGNVVKGGIGSARFIITDKSVEAKTHIYDEEEVLKGKGRKASGQLAWSLSAKGSKAIMREFFGPNTENLVNAREYLLTMGLDITETGEVIQGYEPHTGEERNVFTLPELKYVKMANGNERVDVRGMAIDFAGELSRRGGIIELPFPLKYPTGEDTPPMDDGKRDVVYTKEQWERKGYTRKDGVYVRPTTVTRKLEVGSRQTDNLSWGLPVMSAHLRSGQEFIDGTSMSHDYTNQYLNIFKESIKYLDNKKRFEKATSDKERAEIQAQMDRNQANAQDFYNNITNDLEKRKFEGKHNLFRDGIMARRLPNSATSVWSPDPRLAIDTMAIGPEIAKTLGIDPLSQEKQSVLVWRDPILHDSNIRYMNVLVNPEISGCAINPNMDIPFDGDFDGDTVALVKLNSKQAEKEAKELFSVGANLVDTGHKINIEYQGKDYEVYPLNMNDGLDVQVARHNNKGLDEKWLELTIKANQLHQASEKGQVMGSKKERLQQVLVDKLSDFYYTCANESFGKAQICYDNVENHLQSVYDANIKTGAKGSPAKVKSYTTYLGVDGVEFSDDDIQLDNIVDNHKTLATRDMQQGVMIATNVKNVGTGFAGAVSQRAIRAIGHIDPKVATELSYPATQSILQSKHDPVDAKRRFGLSLGPMRKLWEGRCVSFNEKQGIWQVGKEQATPEEWKKSFYEFYTSVHGMGVKINSDYVERLAKAMTNEFMGTMKSVEAEAEANQGKTEGMLLYRMAYGGTFEQLAEVAKNRENLFEGNFVNEFTPFSVRNNQRSVEFESQAEVDKSIDLSQVKHHAFVKKDVVKDGKDKNVATVKPIAINTPRREANGPSMSIVDKDKELG